MQTYAESTGKPVVAGFFDPRASSIQYVVSDSAAKRCAIIDPDIRTRWSSGHEFHWLPAGAASFPSLL